MRDAISERPVATLSLIWIDDYRHIDQLKGLRNAEVAIHVAARARLISLRATD